MSKKEEIDRIRNMEIDAMRHFKGDIPVSDEFERAVMLFKRSIGHIKSRYPDMKVGIDPDTALTLLAGLDRLTQENERYRNALKKIADGNYNAIFEEAVGGLSVRFVECEKIARDALNETPQHNIESSYCPRCREKISETHLGCCGHMASSSSQGNHKCKENPQK